MGGYFSYGRRPGRILAPHLLKSSDMADYYPLIARAVAGLGSNTPETRGTLYERARAALLTQLRVLEPPLGEAVIFDEQIKLESAIRKIEDTNTSDTDDVRQIRVFVSSTFR